MRARAARALLAVGLILTLNAAQAEPWSRQHHYDWGPSGHYHARPVNPGVAIVNGLTFGLGAAIAGKLIDKATESDDEHVPAPQAPAPLANTGIISIVPWTPEWLDYCANKFRSFDAKTGYYTGFDGLKHFCH